MQNKHQGSCLCDQVKFEVDGPFESFFFCHCKHCQKDTGSAHGANLFSTKAELTWLSGQDKVKTYNLPSTRHTKGFCKECGSALPYQLEGLLVVPAGSLNTEVTTQPTAHIFCSSQSTWEISIKNKDIKRFDKLPS